MTIIISSPATLIPPPLRPLTVYPLGGRILGYRHLYKPPAHIESLRHGLLAVLDDEFFVLREHTGCADESPAQIHLRIVGGMLQANQPPEVLILHGLHSVFETMSSLGALDAAFPDSAVTFVGSKYLLGDDGPYGDPDGNFARDAIRKGMQGGLRAPGFYIASGGNAIPWNEAELIMEVRRKSSP